MTTRTVSLPRTIGWLILLVAGLAVGGCAPRAAESVYYKSLDKWWEANKAAIAEYQVIKPEHKRLKTEVEQLLAEVERLRQSSAPNAQDSTGQSAPPQTTPTLTRRMQLELEGLVNDYCYRQTVEQTVTRVRCYGNVSLSDIIVYICPVDDRSARDAMTAFEVGELTDTLRRDIKGELLDFPDWAWARAYKITVVDKAGR